MQLPLQPNICPCSCFWPVGTFCTLALCKKKGDRKQQRENNKSSFHIQDISVFKSWQVKMMIVLNEPMTRIELVTPSLPRKYSTPELHRQNQSGRRDSNPRPSAWKANALSTELLPQCIKIKEQIVGPSTICAIGWGEQDSNLRRHTPADLQSAPVGRFGISPLINKELF